MQEFFFSSATKHRPKKFTEVIGQEHVVRTLKNAISGHKLPQSFLFHGPRGVGKTTCARILAKTINCENIQANGEACDQCDTCKAFNNKSSLNIFELDAASNNSVENIRGLIDQVWINPQSGKFKIYIIDEVHMLSQAAFNAFLKTLEDPPSYAVFILATTEKHKVLPTILSRCQIFDFHKISNDYIVSALSEIAKRENITADPKALEIIAHKSDGCLRDALFIFDRLASFSDNQLNYEDILQNLQILDLDFYLSLADKIFKGLASEVILDLDQIIFKGFELRYFLQGLAEHFRRLIFIRHNTLLGLANISKFFEDKFIAQSANNEISTNKLKAALGLICQAELDIKNTEISRIFVELLLFRLCATFNPEKESTNTNSPKPAENEKTQPVENKSSQTSSDQSIQETQKAPTPQPEAKVSQVSENVNANMPKSILGNTPKTTSYQTNEKTPEVPKATEPPPAVEKIESAPPTTAGEKTPEVPKATESTPTVEKNESAPPTTDSEKIEHFKDINPNFKNFMDKFGTETSN